MSFLTEDDVPGAKLPNPDIKLNKLGTLKRWLACRGISNNANKPELIKRVTDCIANNQQNNLIVSVDKSEWFYRKFPKSQNKPMPTSGWNIFPSIVIPKPYSYGKIMDYINSRGTAPREDSSSDQDNEYQPTTNYSKSLRRGRICFTSGHVTNIKDNDDERNYFIKSDVYASYSGAIYKVCLALNKTDAQIIEGSCQCKASTSRCCSHILGTLFALEDYTIHFGYQIVSCTSSFKKWNQGRKKDNNPKIVTEAKYETFSKKPINRKRFLEYNPMQQNCTTTQAESTNKFVSDLQTSLPNCMFLKLLKFQYDDYVLDEDSKEILTFKVEQMKKNLNEQVGFDPVLVTASQNSPAWKNARRVRITASVAKAYFTATSYQNLINNQLWSDRDISQIPAIVYGRNNEHNAFLEYKNLKGGDIRQTGFYINSRYSGMGCSPDGIIYDNSGNIKAILEIKCPKRLQNVAPLDYENVPNPNTLCFTMDEFKNLKLKKNHAYYFQIQFSLAIMNLKYCDFIIWSNAGIAIETIERNDVVILHLMPKLIQIHEKIFLVEFFEMRLPRELSLINFLD